MRQPPHNKIIIKLSYRDVFAALSPSTYTPEYIDSNGIDFSASTWRYLADKGRITPEIIDKFGGWFNPGAWISLAQRGELPREAIEEYGQSFPNSAWVALIEDNPKIIDEFPDKISQHVWVDIVQDNPELIDKYGDKFSAETWEELADERMVGHDLVLKYGDKFGRYAWVPLARDDKITPEMIDKYGDRFESNTWYKLAQHGQITPEMIAKYSDMFGGYTWLELANNNELTPEMIDRYGDRFDSDVWRQIANAGRITPEMISKYGEDFSVYVWGLLDYTNPKVIDSLGGKFSKSVWYSLVERNKLTPEMIDRYGDKFGDSAWEVLEMEDKISPEMFSRFGRSFSPQLLQRMYKNKKITKQQLVQLTNKPTEHFKKEDTVAAIHIRQYLFRMLEKYMETNNIDMLSPRDFKGTELERLKDQPLVKEMFYRNNGRPVNKEQIHQEREKLQKQEYYISHGEYRGPTQTEFNDLPTQTFSLGFKEIDSDGEVKSFMEEVGPKLSHSEHTIGFGGENLGWILWKDISSQVNYPAILIEQIQSDWRGLIPKIKKVMESGGGDSEYYRGILEDWGEKHGGEGGLDRIQNKIDLLVNSYPEKLLSAFLERVKGKTVFMTGKDKIVDLIGYRKDMQQEMESSGKAGLANIIYDKMPKWFGFKESTEMPGYLKLEKARMNYRRVIKGGKW